MQTTNVSEILAGMQDNVSEETMNADLKFFSKTARELHTRAYDKLGVIIDEDYEFDTSKAEHDCVTEEKNGVRFIYFKTEEIAEAEYERATKELESEEIDL